MTYEVRRVGVWSCVKIAFILFGILGLIFGVFYAMMLAMIGGFLSQMGGEFGSLRGVTGALGIFMVFFFALFYAVFGAVVTAIMVWIYNLLAKGFGGIRFDLGEEKITAQTSTGKPDSESEGMLGKYKYE